MHLVAALQPQEGELVRGLDAFGDGVQAEAVRHADDGANDGPVFRVMADIAHERLVDLELVHLEPFQVAQGRIAGAEIVDGHADAARVKRIHHRHRRLRVLHRDRLGQFQFQAVRGQPGLAQYARHHFPQTGLAELHRRQIDRHHAVLPTLRQPCHPLRRRGAQHPFADLDDLAAILGHRDELRRRDRPELGMVPAQQSFGADQATVLDGDLRLVVQHEFVALDGMAQLISQLQVARRIKLHGLREEAEGVATLILGPIHCGVGVFGQGLHVISVIRIERDADADRGDHLMRFVAERPRNHVEQLAGHLGCAVRVDVREDQDELVPALARHGIFLAQCRLQALRHLYQQAVADAVAERVVDALEMVEVEEHHRQVLAVALRQAQGKVEVILQQQAVGQAGQLVEMREQADALIGLLPGGDVVLDRQIVAHHALLVAHRRQARPLDVFAAILAPVIEFAFPAFAARQMRPQIVVGRARRIAGLQDARVLPDNLGRPIAGLPGEGGIGVHDVGIEIGDDDRTGRLLDRKRELAQLV